MPTLGKGLSRAGLLHKCTKIIDTFEPKKTTVDSYIQDAAVLKDKSIGEVEYKFIHQVFYGCIRYQKFLKLFVTSFLYKCPTCAIRAEQTVYMVLSYLLFFRLEELGADEFATFVTSGAASVPALHAMLQYAMNVDELERWVKMEWCKLYDNKYIENDIIGKLQSQADALQPLLEEVELKATGTVTTKGGGTIQLIEKRKLTEHKPFNLTAPRPRLIPEPEVISRQIKAQPVPAMINETSLAEVEEEKRKRREEHLQQVREKYDGCEVNLQTADRRDPSEKEELTRKVEEEKMKECTFKPKPPRPYVPPTEEACVRQNVASVLREDALLKKKQAAEYAILKRYEEDLHDASNFSSWQQNMKAKDREDEAQRVQQRIVEMQLARDEAMEAFDSMVRKKRIMAEHQKEEVAQELAVLAMEHERELQGKQQLVIQTIEDRELVAQAQAEVQKARDQHAENMRKEKEQEFERKRREDEFEMERRKDLIRQIRALEKVPVERFKPFDPAEQPSQGLLEEMSLAELRERLRLEEAKHKKEVEDKRERQLEKKLEKQQELAEKAEMLSRIRDMAREESKQRHEVIKQKKREAEEKQQAYREACIEEVAEKIAHKKKQKREEELRLKRELKEISTKRQFLQANAEMNEAKAHAEQQAGLEREARDRQRNLLIDQKKRNDIKVKDINVRRANRAREQDEYRQMQDAVTERINRAKADDVALKAGILMANTSARNLQRASAKKVMGEVGHSSNKYMQRVTSKLGTTKMATSV
mmetsp:Transcript_27987/g.51062  ORF Transcript_27987/g.51062 Transcript_27987/m.51062 type:complete len:762 (+) Transcript_27987:124-2409(+)